MIELIVRLAIQHRAAENVLVTLAVGWFGEGELDFVQPVILTELTTDLLPLAEGFFDCEPSPLLGFVHGALH